MKNQKNKKISFLIYDNRSGSTYLSSRIDQYKDIGVTLESPILFLLLTGRAMYSDERQIDTVLLKLYNDRKFKEWEVPYDLLKNKLINQLPISKGDFIYSILEIYFNRVKPGSKCWVYKNGDPHLIKKIQETFPGAKIIFIYRDGRAVFCSKKRTISRNINDLMETDPLRAASIWLKYIKIVQKIKDQSKVIKIKYEDLIKNGDGEPNKIYQFLIGEQPTSDALSVNTSNYAEKIPHSQSHLHQNITKAPLESKIDEWKKEITEPELYLYEKAAFNTLNQLGYKTSQNKAYKFNRALFMYTVQVLGNRIIKNIKQFSYYSSHPVLFWKKLKTKIETTY